MSKKKITLKLSIWIYFMISNTGIVQCGSYGLGYGGIGTVGNGYSQTRTSRFVDDTPKSLNNVGIAKEEGHQGGILESIHTIAGDISGDLKGSLGATLNNGVLGEGSNGFSVTKDISINVEKSASAGQTNGGSKIEVEGDHGNIGHSGLLQGSIEHPEHTYEQSRTDEHNGGQRGFQVNIKADISGTKPFGVGDLIEKTFSKIGQLASGAGSVGIGSAAVSGGIESLVRPGAQSTPIRSGYKGATYGTSSAGVQSNAGVSSSGLKIGNTGIARGEDHIGNLASASDSYKVENQDIHYDSVQSGDYLNNAGGSLANPGRYFNRENNRNIDNIKFEGGDRTVENLREDRARGFTASSAGFNKYEADGHTELDAIKDNQRKEISIPTSNARTKVTFDEGGAFRLTGSQADHSLDTSLEHEYNIGAGGGSENIESGNQASTTFRKEVIVTSQVGRNERRDDTERLVEGVTEGEKASQIHGGDHFVDSSFEHEYHTGAGDGSENTQFGNQGFTTFRKEVTRTSQFGRNGRGDDTERHAQDVSQGARGAQIHGAESQGHFSDSNFGEIGSQEYSGSRKVTVTTSHTAGDTKIEGALIPFAHLPGASFSGTSTGYIIDRDDTNENININGHDSSTLRKEVTITSETANSRRINDATVDATIGSVGDERRSSLGRHISEGFDGRTTKIDGSSFSPEFKTHVTRSQGYVSDGFTGQGISDQMRDRPSTLRKEATVITSEIRGDGRNNGVITAGANTYSTDSKKTELEYTGGDSSESAEIKDYGTSTLGKTKIVSSGVGRGAETYKLIGQGAINTGRVTSTTGSQAGHPISTSPEESYEIVSDEGKESDELANHGFSTFRKEVTIMTGAGQEGRRNYGSHLLQTHEKEISTGSLRSDDQINQSKSEGLENLGGTGFRKEITFTSTSGFGVGANAGAVYSKQTTPITEIQRHLANVHGISSSDLEYNTGTDSAEFGTQNPGTVRKEVKLTSEIGRGQAGNYAEVATHRARTQQEHITEDQTDRNIPQNFRGFAESQGYVAGDHTGLDAGENHGTTTFRKEVTVTTIGGNTRTTGLANSGSEEERFVGSYSEPKISAGYRHNTGTGTGSESISFGNHDSSTHRKEIGSGRRNGYGGTFNGGSEGYFRRSQSGYGVPQEYNDNGSTKIRKEVTVTSSQIGGGTQVGGGINNKPGTISGQFDFNTNLDGINESKEFGYRNLDVSSTGGRQSSGFRMDGISSGYGSEASEKINPFIGSNRRGRFNGRSSIKQSQDPGYSGITKETEISTHTSGELGSQSGLYGHLHDGILESSSSNEHFRNSNGRHLGTNGFGFHAAGKGILSSIVDAVSSAVQPTRGEIFFNSKGSAPLDGKTFRDSHFNTNINEELSESVGEKPFRSYGGYGINSGFEHSVGQSGHLASDAINNGGNTAKVFRKSIKITSDINNESRHGRDIGLGPRDELHSFAEASHRREELLNPGRVGLKGHLNLGLSLA